MAVAMTPLLLSSVRGPDRARGRGRLVWKKREVGDQGVGARDVGKERPMPCERLSGGRLLLVDSSCEEGAEEDE